jgi:hypothetical protein
MGGIPTAAASFQRGSIIERCKTFKINVNRIASCVVSAQIIEEKLEQEITSLRTDRGQFKDRLKHKKQRMKIVFARAKTDDERTRILKDYREASAEAQRLMERLQAKTQAKSQVAIDDSFRRANSDEAGRFLGQNRTTPFKFLKPDDGLGGKILMGRPPDVVSNRLSKFLHHLLSQIPGLSIKDKDRMVETFLHVGKLSKRARSGKELESFARRQRRIRHTSRK